MVASLKNQFPCSQSTQSKTALNHCSLGVCVGMFMCTTLESCLQNKKATQKPTGSQYPLEWMAEALVVRGSQVQFHSSLLLKINH